MLRSMLILSIEMCDQKDINIYKKINYITIVICTAISIVLVLFSGENNKYLLLLCIVFFPTVL